MLHVNTLKTNNDCRLQLTLHLVNNKKTKREEKESRKGICVFFETDKPKVF